jgi:NitT/TauT family transport system permease protein
LTIIHEWRVSELGHNTLLSTERALVGFGIATVVGTVLGLLIGGAWPRIAEAIEPLVELFAQANPVVLFHVVLLFFGIGEGAKIFVIAWMCTWPIMFSAIGGVRQVDSDLIRTTRSFGLRGWGLCVKCLVPAAIPSILTGMRLSGGYAFIMLVATEMMGTSSGLGWYVAQSQESYHAGRIFAGATIITALALLLDVALKRIEKKLIHWQPEFDERRVLIEDVANGS